MIKFAMTDIDIDFKDRDAALKCLSHTPASIIKNRKITRHNTGVYFNAIPIDPLTGYAAIDYKEAESRGYTKIDFLNLGIYEGIKDETHLDELLAQEPFWDLLLDEGIVTGTSTGQTLFQLHDQFDTVKKMKPNTVLQLAMILALVRPSKRHLIGKTWDEIEKEIWVPPEDDGYYFKKSHAVSYAHLVVIQLNLLVEKALETN